MSAVPILWLRRSQLPSSILSSELLPCQATYVSTDFPTPHAFADTPKPRDGQDVDSFEAQWQSAIEGFLMDNDVVTLQCLVLAQIFCLLRADYSRLLKYKGLAVGLSQRLGLHQSQKRFALGALTSETRKKVFWSLYTVDWYVVHRVPLSSRC
jgi:hypothetical protein